MPLTDARALADFLGCSYQTVRKKVATGTWPSTMLANRILFTPAQIDEILSMGTRPVVEAPNRRRRRRAA